MRYAFVLEELRRDKFMLVVVSIATALVLFALLGPWLIPGDPHGLRIEQRLQAPTLHAGLDGLLGTDQLGRSMVLRLANGLRTSFLIGFLAVALGATAGIVLGMVAGLWGRWLDTLVMRVTDIQMSLPALLVIMCVVAVIGGGGLTLVLALGLNSWMIYARVARSLVLGYRSTDFVLATQASGVGTVRLLGLHILPNAAPPLVALGTLELSRLMIGEATLSFLGFGVQPPTVSLGLVVAQGQDYLSHQWWVSTFAGLLLALAVLTTNLTGNWLNRVTDPLLSWGRA